MNKQYLKFLTYLMLFSGNTCKPKFSANYPKIYNHKVLLSTCGLGIGLILTKLVYDKYFNCEARQIDKAIGAIILLYTPNSTINRLPTKKSMDLYKRKARLNAMYQNIVQKLETIYKQEKDSINSKMPYPQIEALESKIKHAKQFFGVTDFFKKKILHQTNPYENEKIELKPAEIDTENKIVDAIILICKPDENCSKDELHQKKKIERQQELIKQKVETRIIDAGLDKARILQSLVSFFAMI